MTDDQRDAMQCGKLYISIKDSGTGIPEKEIPKIF